MDITDSSAWWARVDATAWVESEIEQGGTTPATWLLEPEHERMWLHKSTFIPATGIEQGEDWAEAVATQVGNALGVPCATVQLALRGERRGSLSLDVCPHGYSLWVGNQWLADRAPGYVSHRETDKGVDPDRPGVTRPGHTLENFRLALAHTAAPASFAGPAQSGFDVLTGFFILDALIGNRDRHTENWAVLEPAVGVGTPCLAPSYDHGGSLGYNVQDHERSRHLEHDGVARWAASSRAWAHRFEHIPGAPRASLLDVALRSLELCSPVIRDWWAHQVHQLDVRGLLDEVRGGVIPSMSDPARRFAAALIETNLERMRDVIDVDT